MPTPFAALDDRQLGALALVVGTVLVLNPLYLTAFHIGSSSYSYGTATVEAVDGDLVFSDHGGDAPTGPIAGIGCTGSRTGGAPLACQVDNHIARNGPLTVTSGYYGGARYTQVDSTFYRRTDSEVDGTVRLGLEPVAAATVLEDVAIPRATLTWPGRVAVRTGGVTTTYPLTHADHVVRTDDGYEYIYRRAAVFRPGGGSASDVLHLAGIAVGLLLCSVGYRRLPSN
jgi:hypothetical protein